ncbi:hypothetical protein AAG570_013869 [Ranatra chinensis]|uniref:C2H2-type domain-containing protein n=1 Tax=Ranatra chinensis TaxID=642074 RepID=A0ABD0YQ06_9HEMI
MASKPRNMFQKNKTQETTKNGGESGGGTAVSRLLSGDSGCLEAVLEAAGQPSTTVARVWAGGGAPVREGAREVPAELGVLCKKCRLVWPSEAALKAHQLRPGSDCRGHLRLIRLSHGCASCDAVLESAPELAKHREAEHPHDSSRLSVEMEDVVNQITALAAKAAAESDSNANIFCPPPPQPPPPKLYASGGLPVPSAGQ